MVARRAPPVEGEPAVAAAPGSRAREAPQVAPAEARVAELVASQAASRAWAVVRQAGEAGQRAREVVPPGWVVVAAAPRARPADRPARPVDLQALRADLRARRVDLRARAVVSLGWEAAAALLRAQLADRLAQPADQGARAAALREWAVVAVALPAWVAPRGQPAWAVAAAQLAARIRARSGVCSIVRWPDRST